MIDLKFADFEVGDFKGFIPEEVGSHINSYLLISKIRKSNSTTLLNIYTRVLQTFSVQFTTLIATKQVLTPRTMLGCAMLCNRLMRCLV